MGLFQLLSPFRRQVKLQQLADRLAAGSVDGVCRRVETQATLMTAAQARGYIRVRSAAVVRPRVQHALEQHPELKAHEAHLVELTTAEVIQRVLTVVRRRRRARHRHAA